MFKFFRKPVSPEGNQVESVSGEVKLNTINVVSDDPIILLQDDTLGRAEVSQTFAQQILSLDTSSGNVVGVLGPWGSGKTSFVNLARKEFQNADVPILDFNPWMFSGTEQLIESFFNELSAQLKMKKELSELAKELEEYGEMFSEMAWVPFIGPWIERGRGTVKIISQILQKRKEGVGGRREKIEKVLKKLNKKIVIVLDDIDRLSTSEIRDIFKLVRLTANFPNIIYIVAFDRTRVEEALSEQGIPGRDYLEKILQVTVDLPSVPSQVLSTQIASAIEQSLSSIDKVGPFNEQAWPDIFMEIIRPLIRNMRDVRRYAISIKVTVSSLKGNVELSDVLALEAIRIFLPDVFMVLHENVEALTTTPEIGFRDHNSQQLKSKIENLIIVAGKNSEIILALIERVFPAAQRHINGSSYGHEWKKEWLQNRRVAHENILKLYLERLLGEELKTFFEAEQVWAYMDNRDLLEDYFHSLDPTKIQDVIASLEIYEDKFESKHVVPSTIVLLNLLPDLPERQRSMFDIDTRMVIGRVTYRLIRSLKDTNLVESAVKTILPEVKSLSSKLELINQIGYREGIGHKLVSEVAAKEIMEKWVEEVQSTEVEDLIKEKEVFRILFVVKQETNESENPLVIDPSPQLTLAILKNSRSEVITQAMGSRAYNRSGRLAWDALIKLYGDEETLKMRIEDLKSTDLGENSDVVQLADNYINGWRPKE
ncbi:KAP family NTPase [Paenibacillus sp. Y412MC10]|uniref:KAP family P-loop NTPase fold protein n=1 Tax=Geobacillus sp. (strain Y412MC10) TaxID=481743 RepID=UPI0021B2365A|nr:KAP family NTPase [Paenibacillus sp. Y412MC10]